MLTYYIGNIREKRMLFRAPKPQAVLADNTDVLADFKLNGKVCFVLGDIPYANMRVGEYLGYARSLKTRLPIDASEAKRLLQRVGLRVRLSRKMRSLPRYLFRGVLLAAALEDDTRHAWINLDGVAYSRRTCRNVRRMLQSTERMFEEVHAAVSDYRFIPKNARVRTAACGALREGGCKSASRPCGKLYIDKRRRKSNLALSALNGHKMLTCDN